MSRDFKFKLLIAGWLLGFVALAAVFVHMVAASFIPSSNFVNVCFSWCIGAVVVCGMSSLVLLAVASFCDIIDDGRASK